MKRIIPIESTPSRHGALLIFAMVALLVTSLIGAALLRNSMLALQQLRREQLHLQAALLAESGCQRAVAKLKSDGGYTSEIWQIPADQLPAKSAAMVNITVAEADGGRTIAAVAEYPRNSTSQIRVTKKLTLHPRTSSKRKSDPEE